ncbi:hypothetical protein Hypma_010540 [Hypsizygus marmoreus]|uniref:Uncharacterized protein n=1 Tax=Hypsizygus marmoreus TaxID=39966 RepID=A0A369JPQ1_HYPMA|nr:hypothetical protein Hypma_010540 [Hypsizygus marmoreus]
MELRLQGAAKLLSEELTEVVQEIGNGFKTAATQVNNMMVSLEKTTTSYRDVLTKNTPTQATAFVKNSTVDPRTQAREGIWLRQILLDFEGGPANPELHTMTNPGIITLTNNALQEIDCPEEYKIVGITKLRKGSLLFEANCTDAAKWISMDNKFMSTFDSSAILRRRQYPVIIHFAPTTFDPTSVFEIDQVEEDNNIERRQLSGTRWIKPIERRQNPDQKVAYLSAKFSMPEAVNTAIGHGLLVGETWLTVVKSMCKLIWRRDAAPVERPTRLKDAKAATTTASLLVRRAMLSGIRAAQPLWRSAHK